MQSLRSFLMPLAVLAGLSACAPMPGEEFINQGRQSTLQGDWDGSINALNQALKMAKDDEVFYYSFFRRCDAYTWKGLIKNALEDCNSSIRAMPEFYGYPYAARGRVFALMGQHVWALEDYNVASRLKSARFGYMLDSATVLAYGGKARIFATSPEDGLRNAEKGIEFAKAAVGYEEYVKTPAHKILNRDTLAAAYPEAGKFSEAVAEQKKTIAMIRENGWESVTYGGRPLLSILNRHLNRFEAGQPLRGGIY